MAHNFIELHKSLPHNKAVILEGEMYILYITQYINILYDIMCNIVY